MYNVPPCHPPINKTVNEDICKLLNTTILGKKRITYLRLLHYFNEMAMKQNWTYFMAKGTLLGSWRHHGFVPWDQDVDLYIDFKHRKDIISTVEAQERFVPKQIATDQIKLYDKKVVLGGSYYRNLGQWYGPNIDLWFYKENFTHIFKSDEIHTLVYVWKKSDVFPVKKRPFEELEIPAPKEILQYLVRRYGDLSICKRFDARYQPVYCKDLDKYVAFVQRKVTESTMEEKLVLGENVLHVKYL
jgi:phosphorylcholine metabolism protein LicD